MCSTTARPLDHFRALLLPLCHCFRVCHSAAHRRCPTDRDTRLRRSSVKLCVQFITQFDVNQGLGFGKDLLSTTGISTVLALLAFETYVLLKYALGMYKLRNEGAFALIGLTPQRLTRRLAYLTNRFAPTTQYYWQFVICAPAAGLNPIRSHGLSLVLPCLVHCFPSLLLT